MKITFLGAVGEVTGSKYLVQDASIKILIDCGFFQGSRELVRHNWDSFPIDPSSIDAVVLTHAHLDHTGYIPVLCKAGFKGKIYCSAGTKALAEIVLKDNAILQEEEVEKLQKYHDGSIKQLYNMRDVDSALQLFEVVPYSTPFQIGSLQITLIQSFHILGSNFVIVSNGSKTVTFSGDLGRPHQLLMKSPPHLQKTDYLVLESTYGDRLHDHDDPMHELGDIVQKVIVQKGILIIPAFAIERTQLVLYCLYRLKEQKKISDIPIYVDSPMATSVTHLFEQFKDEHTLSVVQYKKVFDDGVSYVRTMQGSKNLDGAKRPAIIIAGSGMAEGGRVIDHLAHYITDPTSTILFVGFQSVQSTGRALINGAKTIVLYDKEYPVRAKIEVIHSFSAHADQAEILQWLSYFTQAPKKTFLTHGEQESAKVLQKKIEERFGWLVVVPKYSDSFELD